MYTDYPQVLVHKNPRFVGKNDAIHILIPIIHIFA
ncbi:MAG: hypothetical protein K0Q94_4158 [Paenibacillus sp.]|nr:hypothetical protein [Paenibacillus sp.]